MKDYYKLENKIEENRRFLRETQDKYEKTRTYYPLFFFYLGFLGVYTFDFIQHFFTNPMNFINIIFGVLLTVHICLFIYCLTMFIGLFKTRKTFIDINPKLVYLDITEESDKKTKTNNLKSYLLGLERDCEANFETLVQKRRELRKIIKFGIYSFILYISLITFYKIITMEKDKALSSNEIIAKPSQSIDDGKIMSGELIDSGFTERQKKEIREIFLEEIIKYRNGKLDSQIVIKQGQAGVQKDVEFENSKKKK